ncbi:MAG: replicative DNA helicase [Phycisphaeraceae bacterium]|nr:replicative DNA helicase [Phycisphaeraceae bacterium]
MEREQGNGRQRREGRVLPDADKLNRLFDRLPPHAAEAEMALLGCMILGPEVIPDVMAVIKGPQSFFSTANGVVYEALVRLFDQHRAGDLVSLVDALRGHVALEPLGGEEYLVRLAEAVPSPVSAPHYARIVAEKARLRGLIDAAGSILHEAYHAGDVGGEGVREVLDRAEMMVFDVCQEDQTNSAQPLSELLHQEYERIEAQEGKGITGLRTGFADLDELLHGLHPGEMVVIAARPSMGKTALALNLAEQIALGGRTPWDSQAGGGPVPVAFFSLEMSRSAVTLRLLSAHSGVSASRFREGRRIPPEDLTRLEHACSALSRAPIFIDDSPGLTVMQLRARARRLAAQHGIRAIMVDYLQLLSAPGASRDSRQVEVSEISRQIKALARQLGVPVICLSQLNRASEQREGNRPRMSDLRESGAIEQDADVVMLLHREEYYHLSTPKWAEENPDKVGQAELIIAKQRNGPTGVVTLTWSHQTTRFKSHTPVDPYAHAHQPAPGVEPKPAGAFRRGVATGPAADHRDGGGPDRYVDEDDTGGAPF